MIGIFCFQSVVEYDFIVVWDRDQNSSTKKLEDLAGITTFVGLVSVNLNDKLLIQSVELNTRQYHNHAYMKTRKRQ